MRSKKLSVVFRETDLKSFFIQKFKSKIVGNIKNICYGNFQISFLWKLSGGGRGVNCLLSHIFLQTEWKDEM